MGKINNWSKTIDERFEIAYHNGRQTIYANKSSKHKGWIVGIESPSDGYVVTHPNVRTKTDARNVISILINKNKDEFY